MELRHTTVPLRLLSGLLSQPISRSESISRSRISPGEISQVYPQANHYRAQVAPQIQFGACAACLFGLFSLETLDGYYQSLWQELQDFDANRIKTDLQKEFGHLIQGEGVNPKSPIDVAGRNRLTAPVPLFKTIVRDVLVDEEHRNRAGLGHLSQALIDQINTGLDHFNFPKGDLEGKETPLQPAVDDLDAILFPFERNNTDLPAQTFMMSHVQRYQKPGDAKLHNQQKAEPIGWVNVKPNADSQSLTVLSSMELPSYSGLDTAASGVANILGLLLTKQGPFQDNAIETVYVMADLDQEDLLDYLENRLPKASVKNITTQGRLPDEVETDFAKYYPDSTGQLFKIDLRLFQAEQNQPYTALMAKLMGLAAPS